MKGKGCNIAAGVLDIILSVCYFGYALIVLFAGTLIGELLEALGGTESGSMSSGSVVVDAGGAVAGIIVFIAALIFFVGFVIYLAFGITTLVKSGKQPDEYNRARGAMLGFSIVETIMLIGLTYLSISAVSVLTIVLLAITAAAVVLHWVGFALNKKNEPALPIN